MTQTELLPLAPAVLPNRRARRYHGDDLAISIEQFVEADQSGIRQLYAFLQELFGALQSDDDARPQRFQSLCSQRTVDSVIASARQLGAASYRANPTPLLAKTIHDVRGGGLTPLLGHLQLGTPDRMASSSLFFLARDHLKIMRNALLGLDDQKRNEDLEIKIHGTDFIVEKWSGTRLPAGGREVELTVDCPQPAAISECCVEFGAVDRILYNMLNNACRHTADGSVRLVLFPVPDQDGENLRLVLVNTVTDSDAAHLQTLDLRTLFRAGVSTTGSGYGLNVAAELVANAFGLNTPEEAVAARYLGAELQGTQFIIWFHWPIVSGY